MHPAGRAPAVAPARALGRGELADSNAVRIPAAQLWRHSSLTPSQTGTVMVAQQRAFTRADSNAG
jgi:hypothetical protein